MRVPRDVVLLPEDRGRWIAFNVFSRTSLGVGAEVLALLASLAEGSPEPTGPFRVWEVERFSTEEGLLADPSRFVRDVDEWPEAEALDSDETLERLAKHLLVADDEAAYEARLAPKRDLLDFEHVGNLHQQLGQHLLLVRREDPRQWWLRQKFEPGLRSIRPGPYEFVQLAFVERLFTERVSQGDRVLDLGCGVGFYANLLASNGATVLGIDPDPEYVRTANELAVDGVSFEVMEIGVPGGLDALADASFDLVFMSDALLFYSVPIDPLRPPSIETLVADVHRVLRSGGSFLSLEPHPVFFQQPWLGDANRPFTILTEYLDRSFGITGTTGGTLTPFLEAGFALRRLEEVRADPTRGTASDRGFEFARRFPIWQYAELLRQ